MHESRTEDHGAEKEIFFAALDQPNAEARAAFLDGACGQNPVLRRRIERLLGDHFEPDSFLDAAAVEGPPTGLGEAPLSEGPGALIDRYKLLQELGEGGFGVVYMAEQKVPVKRRVALKIIKLGMDTKQVVARFEAERQALAMMNHPNIAKVLDAGATETGRPYFVMELVKGVPITRYCDDNHLTTRERLELFMQVCQAIQHAHQKGVIHRDIKPSNVMVTLHDGVPVSKVIDFGIAKATQMELTEKTLFTQYAQLIGTPAYMSPEQAEMSGLDIDTRTDIYSLGVLLYELLVGKTPLDAKALMSGGYDEIRRRIREEEPAKPSTRLSTLNGEERTTVARHRGIGAGQLGNELKGDLDWIVLKALEKDRTRRYETANGLLLDIKRHLADEPVRAVAPSVIYKMRKFARRNKLVFAAASAITAALVLGLGLAILSYANERAARADADRKTQEAVVARNDAEGERIRAERLRNEAERARTDAETHRQAEKQARQEAESLLKTSRLQTYQSDMNLASRQYEAGNFGHMNGLLQKHWPDPGEPDLRGFEWYHWWRVTQLQGDYQWGGPWQGFEFSPDRSTYAVVQEGRWLAVQTWPSYPEDGTSPARLATLRIPSGWSPITFTPDGAFFLVGNPDGGTIEVYNTETWTAKTIMIPGGGGIQAFAWTPAGDLMATGGIGERIVLWDGKTRQPLGAPMESTGTIWDLSFARDGKTLWAALEDGTIVAWDVAERSVRATMTGHGNRVKRVVASPTADFFATGSYDRTVRLWDRDFNLVGTYDAFGPIEELRFSSDGTQLLAATSENNCVLVWEVAEDPPTLRLVHEIKGHSAAVWAAEFAPGNKLVTTSEDATFKIWDLASCDPFVTLDTDPVRLPVGDNVQIGYSPDGEEISVLDEAGDLHRWEVESRRPIRSSSPAGDFRLGAFSPGGDLQAGLSVDRRLEVRDAKGETLWVSLATVDSVFDRMTVSANGNTVAGANADGIRLWDRGRKQSRFIESNGRFQPLRPALSPDGTRLAVSELNSDWATSVWDLSVDEPTVLWMAKGWGPEECSQFSPDGSILAIGSWRSDIRLHDAETGIKLQSLEEHRKPVVRLAFSPDGSRLVSCGEDQTLCIWDPVTGALLTRLKSALSTPAALAWSPQADKIAALYEDGSVKLWTSGSRQEVIEDIPHYLYVADRYTKQGMLDKALLVLDEADRVTRAEHLGKYRVDVLGKRAQRYLQKGDRAAAIADLSEAISLGRSETLLMKRGELYLQIGQRSEAIGDYAGALMMGGPRREPSKLRALLATINRGAALAPIEGTWRYTRNLPSDNWKDPDGFDDSEWREDKAPLGTYLEVTRVPDVPQSSTWLRRTFDAGAHPVQRPVLHIYADDHVEVFLNGVPAAGAGWVGSRYQVVPCAEGCALRPGKNTLAVLWTNQDAGQKFDLGLYAAGDDLLFDEVITRAQNAFLDGEMFARGVGEYYALHGRWMEAAGQFRRIVDLAAGKGAVSGEAAAQEAVDWMRISALLVTANERDAHARLCQEMLERFANPDAPEVAERVAKACLVVPIEGRLEVAAKMAEVAVKKPIPGWLAPHAMATMGLAGYRLGKFAEAARWSQEGLDIRSDGYAGALGTLVLAMSQQRLGRAEAARAELAKAGTILNALPDEFDREALSGTWHDRLFCQALSQEAEELIGVKPLP